MHMGSYYSRSIMLEDQNNDVVDHISEKHIIEHQTKDQKKDQYIKEQHRQIKELRTIIELLKFGKKTTQYNKEIVKNIAENKKNKKYENLVFSGGGMKGLAYCGAVEVLEKFGILKNIKRYAGSSAGSIMASLLAIGYTPTELTAEISKIDFSKIIGVHGGYVQDAVDIYKILQNYGVSSGDYFTQIISELIERKTGNKDYTIDDLYRDKNIILVINSTDMSHNKTIYFYPNHKNKAFKNVPIRKAIRMSMSVPILLKPVDFNDCLCVDGGLLDIFPIHVFDGEYPGDPMAKSNLCKPNPATLGLNIMTKEEIAEIMHNKKKVFKNFIHFAISLINIFMIDNERKMLVPSFWNRTINIITKKISLVNFKLTDEQKKNLLQDGRHYANEFFDDTNLVDDDID